MALKGGRCGDRQDLNRFAKGLCPFAIPLFLYQVKSWLKSIILSKYPSFKNENLKASLAHLGLLT